MSALAVIVGAGAALLLLRRPGAQGVTLTSYYQMDEVGRDIAAYYAALLPWKIPEAAYPYLHLFQAAEFTHGIPAGLLVRVAYQESRFRQDIITGKTVSGAGAQGIMQIVPRWHPGVDPLNVPQAIDYAAGYLASLYRQFKSWPLALAAYNWGQGNLRQKGMALAPKETRDYVSQISRDMGVGGVSRITITAGGVAALAAVAALGALAVYVVSRREAIGAAVVDRVNPASPGNIIYDGVIGGTGRAITGNKDWSLGVWLWELFNPAAVARENRITDPVSQYFSGGGGW